MTTVIKGESISNMRDFFRAHCDDYRFYNNIEVVPEWIENMRSMGSPEDSTPLLWVTEMLHEDAGVRPTAFALFNSITHNRLSLYDGAMQHSFCGPCCTEHDDDSSDVTNGDLDPWADEGGEEATVKAWKMDIFSM